MNRPPIELPPLWTSQVLIPIEGENLLTRLEAMDQWLSEWNIPYLVVPPAMGDSTIVVRFPMERFARAFIAQQFRDAEPARGKSSGRGLQAARARRRRCAGSPEGVTG